MINHTGRSAQPCLSISCNLLVCDAAVVEWSVTTGGWWKETWWGDTNIRQVHRLCSSPPPLPSLPLSFPQMYLAAVSVKVTGESVHGKRSGASWVESCGRIFSAAVCLSVCWSETCWFFSVSYSSQSACSGKLQHLQLKRFYESLSCFTRKKEVTFLQV